MTDNEIIKDLECCAQPDPICKECHYYDPYLKYPCADQLKWAALNLIDSQKSEIERLTAQNGVYETCNARKQEAINFLENSLAISKKETKRYKALCQTIQSETVKGVAFMLRAMGAGRLAWDEYDEEIYGFLTVDEIDNLLKEFMEGGNTQ